MRSTIEIHPVRHESGDAVITGSFHAPGYEAVTVTFRMPEASYRHEVRAAETFTLIFLLPAMRVGLPLRVDASLDAVFMRHLSELTAFWSTLVPEKYRNITVDAAARAKAPAGGPRSAVSCFSGGVDSCYSAFQLSGSSFSSWLPCPLKGLLMIHGLDIPAEEHATFEAALKRCDRIAQACGLQLHRLWTDARKLEGSFELGWGPEFHAFPLAAGMHLLSHKYECAVIPSTYAYDQLMLPWGSNPVSDPLLGSGLMPILHHGASADKFDKVSGIYDKLAVADNLRVCWEGSRKDRNCGRCFKCIATHVAFVINGVTKPGCFPGELDLSSIESLVLKSEPNKALFRKYASQATALNLSELSQALEICLQKSDGLKGTAGQMRRTSRFIHNARRFCFRT